MATEKSVEKKSPYVKGPVENSGGHRAWNRNPKAKFRGTNSMSKQVISNNRKKV